MIYRLFVSYFKPFLSIGRFFLKHKIYLIIIENLLFQHCFLNICSRKFLIHLNFHKNIDFFAKTTFNLIKFVNIPFKSQVPGVIDPRLLNSMDPETMRRVLMGKSR